MGDFSGGPTVSAPHRFGKRDREMKNLSLPFGLSGR